MTTSTTTVTVEVVKGRNFSKGVKYAKRFGGRFDSATKTWQIPADKLPPTKALAVYGLRLVAGGGCGLWTDDQGCPLHGEACAEGKV